MIIRFESAEDALAIRFVNEAAFGGPDEAVLVDRLRRDGDVLVSLVAALDERVVGHVLFSRMHIGSVAAVALAPVAVLPEYQRRGIGERLIRRGLERLREMGEGMVIVVGHAGYYPRFGFSTEQAREIESPFPRDVFMAMELQPGALENVGGPVRYPAAFGL